jgi:hypothetical protein
MDSSQDIFGVVYQGSDLDRIPRLQSCKTTEFKGRDIHHQGPKDPSVGAS